MINLFEYLSWVTCGVISGHFLAHRQIFLAGLFFSLSVTIAIFNFLHMTMSGEKNRRDRIEQAWRIRETQKWQDLKGRPRTLYPIEVLNEQEGYKPCLK